MNTTFMGKKLLVVGGTSGMGLATAKRVVENGGSVVLVGNRRQKAEQARQALAAEGKVDVIVADLMSESGMQQVMAAINAEHQDISLLVNAAGVYADDIYKMVGDPYFKILARRGVYFIFDKEIGDLVHNVIFPCPTKNGKGILVSPTVHGNLLIGPDAMPVDKGDICTTQDRLDYIKENALKNCTDFWERHGPIARINETETARSVSRQYVFRTGSIKYLYTTNGVVTGIQR